MWRGTQCARSYPCCAIRTIEAHVPVLEAPIVITAESLSKMTLNTNGTRYEPVNGRTRAAFINGFLADTETTLNPGLLGDREWVMAKSW